MNLQLTPVYSMEQVSKRREKGGNLFELTIPVFVAHAGEFIAIVGESGCGKSTLLDILALIMQPTSAERFEIHIPGQDWSYEVMSMSEPELAAVRRARLGYVLQTGGLLPFLSVQDNISLPCKINGLRDSKDHFARLVSNLKISDQLTKKPQFLSGGQRQRAAIARALAHQPCIVLADEPTAAVDKVTAVEIRDTFKELTRQMGVALLMVTHDERLVEDVADRTFTFQVTKVNERHTVSICYEKDG